MPGRLYTVTWHSCTGLHLTLLLVLVDARQAVLEHRSVHTGEAVKIVPLDLPMGIWEAIVEGSAVTMEWRDENLAWEDPPVSRRVPCS
jgi:hypothetical protein